MKKYCFNMKLYPLFIIQDKVKAHVDKWATVRSGVLYYSIKNKRTGVWTKTSMSLTEAKRIVGEMY